MDNLEYYELVFAEGILSKLGDNENKIAKNIEHLKTITLGLVKLVNTEETLELYGEFVEEDISCFKRSLTDKGAFVLCSKILSKYALSVYQVYSIKSPFDFKVRCDYCVAIPDSKRDDDQIYYQMGYSDCDVSSFALYQNNKLIANYGSSVRGYQDVTCHLDENGELCLEGELYDEEREIEEHYTIEADPDLLLRAQQKQHDTGEEYLFWNNNCWLEDYCFLEEDNNGNDYSDPDNIYGSVSDSMCLSTPFIEDILKAIEKLRDVA